MSPGRSPVARRRAGGGAAAMLRGGAPRTRRGGPAGVGRGRTTGPRPSCCPGPGREPTREASVWVHNRTSSVVAAVELRATVLISDAERHHPGDAVTFHPEGAVVVEPGTCREVGVRVSVPEGQPPGHYHGLLSGSGGARRCGHAAPRGRGRRGRDAVTGPRTAFLEQLDDYGRIGPPRSAVVPAGQRGVVVRRRPGRGLPAPGRQGPAPGALPRHLQAFGGDVEDALPSAAAIELLHTAFLVHDDVEDDSELRRGGPTLHRQYGRALAINAGDGLAVLALGALRDNERPARAPAGRPDLVGVRPHGPADGRRAGARAGLAARAAAPTSRPTTTST